MVFLRKKQDFVSEEIKRIGVKHGMFEKRLLDMEKYVII